MICDLQLPITSETLVTFFFANETHVTTCVTTCYCMLDNLLLVKLCDHYTMPNLHNIWESFYFLNDTLTLAGPPNANLNWA